MAAVGCVEGQQEEKTTMRQGSGSRRSRGRANGKRPFNQGQNRSFESNGPGVKLRGTAAQVFDKYLALARDASSAGDRIAAENFYQHAEHYYRLHSAFNAERKLRSENERQDGDGQQDDDDDAEITTPTNGGGAEQELAAAETAGEKPEEQADASVSSEEEAPAKPRRRRRSSPAKDTEAETVA